APATVRTLREQGHVRENYRGVAVAVPAGVAIVAAAIVALVPLALLAELAGADVFARVDAPVGPVGLGQIALFVFGVAVLGLIDDLAGSAAGGPRGWRGHVRATAEGRLSTGALKAVGTLGLGLFVLAGAGLG